LAVSEALNNTIEHAYRGAGGTIQLRMEIADGLLTVEIADRGSWVSQTPSDERGRGLLLMRTLMDSVEVDTNGSGTTVTLERRLVREPAAVPSR